MTPVGAGTDVVVGASVEVAGLVVGAEGGEFPPHAAATIAIAIT